MILDLLIGAAIAVGLIKDAATTSIANDDFKRMAKANNDPTYCDSKGRRFLMDTGEQVIVTHEKNHCVIKSLNGRIIRDLTQEKNNAKEEEARKEAVANGKRFYQAYSLLTHGLYKEVSTGKVYDRVNGSWGDRFHNPDVYYVEVIIKNGKRDYSASRKFHRVYEYGEGPTDEELEERQRLFKKYNVAEERYNKSSDWNERPNLFNEYIAALMEYRDYKMMIDKKYFLREGH